MSLGSIDMYAALDRYLTTPPDDPETVFKCEQCEEDFFPGDEYYYIEGENLCPRCAERWFDSMRRTADEDLCFGD